MEVFNEKIYLKFILFFILLLIVVIPNNSFAISSSGGYTVESYDIDMVVNEDNTFDITERITAYFTTAKHGIFRKIPLENNVKRVDGTTSNNKAKITNLEVSENYKKIKEFGNEIIVIGDINNTVIGRHTYTIKYKYNIGKDPLKNADELYYNLIGSEWGTSISNVTFKITMPKEFDENLLGFSSGDVGSTNSSDVYYTVNGNIISGTLNNTLKSGQALTIRLTLPEGYFVGAKNDIDIYSIAVMIFSLVCVLISDRLWSKYGKDDKVVETVEFYPPEGFNSAEVGFLYEGSATTPAIISLLIYLANKGYLKIEETEELGLFKMSKGFRITKIKEYDGNNENERIFFNGLFKRRNSVDMEKVKEIIKEAKRNGEKINYTQAIEMATATVEKPSVTSSDLYDNFYRTLDIIKSNFNSKENKNKIFESTATGKKKCLIMMIIALFVLITVKPIMEYSSILGLFTLPFALIFTGIGFTVLIGGFIGLIKMPKIFAIIFGVVLGVIPWCSMVLPVLVQNSMNLIMYIVGIICIAVILMFLKIMPKRTDYGNEMLGKVKGFKRFLQTAEKSKLESLVTQNPEYFYNILPYTYALGVSNIWINQFENIALQAPHWYDSRDDFNVHDFGIFMNTAMSSATTAMSTRPSSDGAGGSSSGGGSSGGGGGGSW